MKELETAQQEVGQMEYDMSTVDKCREDMKKLDKQIALMEAEQTNLDLRATDSIQFDIDSAQVCVIMYIKEMERANSVSINSDKRIWQNKVSRNDMMKTEICPVSVLKLFPAVFFMLFPDNVGLNFVGFVIADANS